MSHMQQDSERRQSSKYLLSYVLAHSYAPSDSLQHADMHTPNNSLQHADMHSCGKWLQKM